MSEKQLQTLQFQKLQKIVVNDLDQDQKQIALKFTNDRGNSMNNFIRDTIDHCDQFYKIESSTLANVNHQLTQTNHQLQDRKAKNRLMLDQLYAEQKQAELEFKDLKNYQPQHNEIELKKKIHDLKAQISELNKQRLTISEDINCQVLSTIVIKNKDQDAQINELFKWCILFLYKDPVNNYYWPNFRLQAFVNDKGIDFRERCCKIKAVDLKKDEVIKTELILSIKDLILGDPLLTHNSQIKVSVELIFKIMEIILKINDLGFQIHSIDNLLAEQTQANVRIAIDLEKIENRIQILKERVFFQDHIYHIYDKLLIEVGKKLHSYSQAQSLNNQFINQLNNEYKGIDLSKHYLLTYVPEPAKKEQVETPYEVEQYVVYEDNDAKQGQQHQTSKPVDVKYQYDNEDENKQENKQEAKQEMQLPPQRTENTVDRKEGGCQDCSTF